MEKSPEIKRERREKHRRESTSSSSSSSRSRSRERRTSRKKSKNCRRRSNRSRSRSRSRSSCHRRIRYYGTRENPYETRVVGIFGLSSMTDEAKLMQIFSPFGVIEHVSIIHDAKTGNSRGFGFVYYAQIEHATLARTNCNGMTLDGKRIRVDYSITRRPHTQTPGVYMGTSSSQEKDRRRRRSRSDDRRRRRYSRRSLRPCSRSYSRSRSR